MLSVRADMSENIQEMWHVCCPLQSFLMTHSGESGVLDQGHKTCFKGLQ